MFSHTHMGRTIVLTAALLVLTAGCASLSLAPSASVTAVPLSGTIAAVDFTNGYITLGSGDTIVDSYFDLMCPYCAEFEMANGDYLAELVDAGTITLRLHPMVFLDRLSMGTEYSTRATNALIGVAVASPETTLPYLHLLLKNKPEENSTGLTDDQLAAYAAQATPEGTMTIALDQVLRDRPYAAWAASFTASAMAEGGIIDADVTMVDSVPLNIVNGHTYSGDLSDSAAFAAFVAAN